jgi:hypothetical protein
VFGFTKHVIDSAFRAEGVTTFDVDKDGVRDIVTRELWWRGPGFTRGYELREPMAFDVATQYATSFHATHLDVDGDGYEDLISWGFPGQGSEWCKNPQGRDVHWTCTEIAPINQGETPGRFRLLAAGPESIVTGIGGAAERRLALISPRDSGAAWNIQDVSPMDFEPAQHHGLGAVDINGDKRVDLVTGAGWLEQPANASGQWPWHPTEISPNNISHISGHDFNEDGRVDLIGSSPHNRGVWWLEQGGPSDAPTFTKHLIDESISQTHASVLYDMDFDGNPDLVTGKRWYAHFAGDPGIDEPVVLVIYRYARDADGTLTWTRFDVDNDSGVGNEFDVVDLNLDGKADIVAATRKGVFWFEQN